MKRKPDWLKIKIQGDKTNDEVEKLIKKMHLHTVCHEANCPNKMECYERGTATFMIMGSICTRNCKFCNVTTKKPLALDPKEPEHIAEAVKHLGLRHAVITSPDRDDLPDEGAWHFKKVSEAIKALNPMTTVELLIPDFHAKHELLDVVFSSKPEVLNHNMEVVEALHKDICPQSDFENSIEVLRYAKEKGFVTKTGLMLGLGETKEQVIDLLKKLRKIDVDMITIGQYLQPSLKHIEVSEYVHPEVFESIGKTAKEMGFKRVDSSPFVRSSYHADTLNEDEKEMC